MDYKVFQERLKVALGKAREAVVTGEMPGAARRLSEDELYEVWAWAEARHVASELDYQLMNAYWPRTSGPEGMLAAAEYLSEHPEEAADLYREVAAACWDCGMADSVWDAMGAATGNWLRGRER